MGDMSQATTLYDVHDRPVFTIFKEYRVEVPLSRMSPHLRKAILAIEDQRFAEHRGVDLVRIAAAAWTDLRRGAARAGRQHHHAAAGAAGLPRPRKDDRPETQRGGAGHTHRAHVLERRDPRAVPEQGVFRRWASWSGGRRARLLRKIGVGSQLVRSGAAGRPGQLAVEQRADGEPDSRAVARRNIVLQAMFDEGIITRDGARSRAGRRKLELRDTLRRQEPIGQYFKEEVRQQLVKQFGWQRISEGGLRVYTTIDPDMQKAAEAAIAQTLQQIEAAAGKRGRKTSGPCQESGTAAGGARRASIRQLAKCVPWWAAATFRTAVSTAPCRRIVSRGRRSSRSCMPPRWSPATRRPRVIEQSRRAHQHAAGRVDSRGRALDGVRDDHADGAAGRRATVRPCRCCRPSASRRPSSYARGMGIGHVPSVPSLALGSGEVTLMSMTSAYSVFAATGMHRPAVLIRRVEDRAGARAVSGRRRPGAGAVAHHGISHDQHAGRRRQPRHGVQGAERKASRCRRPERRERRTTFVDAWFVGFTPSWLRASGSGSISRARFIANGFAGDLAVPLWTRFMKAATTKDKPEWFTPPSGIVTSPICAEFSRRIRPLRA